MSLLRKVISLEGLGGVINSDQLSLDFVDTVNMGFNSFFGELDLNGWKFLNLSLRGYYRLGDKFFMVYDEGSESVGSVNVERDYIPFDKLFLSFGKDISFEGTQPIMNSLKSLGFRVPELVELGEDYDIVAGDTSYSLSTFDGNSFDGKDFTPKRFSTIELYFPANIKLDDYHPKYFL